MNDEVFCPYCEVSHGLNFNCKPADLRQQISKMTLETIHILGEMNVLSSKLADAQKEAEFWKSDSALFAKRGDEFAAEIFTLKEENKRLKAFLEKYNLLEIIEEWQMIWRNQKINPEDTIRYRRRALSVDANMRHSLARMISQKGLRSNDVKPPKDDDETYFDFEEEMRSKKL